MQPKKTNSSSAIEIISLNSDISIRMKLFSGYKPEMSPKFRHCKSNANSFHFGKSVVGNSNW